MRLAFTVSRATICEPIAAWIATSNSCRGISSRSRSTICRPYVAAFVAVHDRAERVDRLAVQQHVDAHEEHPEDLILMLCITWSKGLLGKAGMGLRPGGTHSI